MRTFVRLCVAAALALLVAAGPADAARSLARGFADGVYLESGAPTWLDRTVQADASVIRITPQWSAIAPATRPAGFDPSNPADPAYDWAAVDAAVRDADARGLQVIFTILGAPTWAEGPHRSRRALPGTWRPDPAQLGAFARAAAARYSGSFPDPADPGRVLPRIRLWQVWNEPNLDTYLTPQWVRHGPRFTAEAPVQYRAMLNAAYAGIHSVHADNLVGTAGTAPFGDPKPGGHRIRPVAFFRTLLCLTARLRPARCPNPAHFDAYAHHPYSIGGPNQHAFSPDDAAVPDLGRLRRVVDAARRDGRAFPRGPKQLWVTEISWDSNPPDPQGVPMQTEARWLEESFYVLWRQGVVLATWFQIRDQDASGGYANSNQSGVYLRDGTPKLSLQAYRFPFVVERRGRRALAWGVAPESGSITLQRQVGRTWRTVATARGSRSKVFTRSLGAPRRGLYRALESGNSSLSWQFR